MKRYGYDVLINESSWRRWMKKEGIYFYLEKPPAEYPCIAESLLDSDEDPYGRYIYFETVETMRKALSL